MDRTPSPFWSFSLAFYRQPGVAEACLALQDDAGADVNLVLFLLWQAQQGRSFGEADVARMDAAIRPWREATVIPLRDVRRQLKSLESIVPREAAETFRSAIKAAELQAEQLQQEAMYATLASGRGGEPAGSVAAAARTSLAAYEPLCRNAFPAAAVGTLAGMLAAAQQGGADCGS